MLKGHEIGGNYDHARCLCTARRCALLQQNLPSTSPPDLLGRACSRWTVLAPLLASLRHRVRLESFRDRSPVQNLKLLPPLRDRLSSLHLRLCFTTPSKCLPEREIVTFLSFSYPKKNPRIYKHEMSLHFFPVVMEILFSLLQKFHMSLNR